MSTTTTATRTAPIHTVKVGDVIMPPKREVSLWMRRTLREHGLSEAALHLTVTAVREGAPDKGGRWLVITAQHNAEWEKRYPAENRGRPFGFKARPDTAWEFIGAPAPVGTKSEHTPGPWSLSGYGHVQAFVEGEPVAGYPTKINREVCCYQKNPNAVADAALITAAPELLLELRKLEWSNHRDGDSRCPVCGQHLGNPHTPACSLGAALAKAEG